MTHILINQQTVKKLYPSKITGHDPALFHPTFGGTPT